MNQQIDDNQRYLSRKYLLYKLLTNLFFTSAVWLYFYRIFITDQQVGILDGLAFAIGLIAEIPSGALADSFGRDKMVKLGQFLAGGGFLIQAFGSGYVQFFIGQVILVTGVSFVSGADEALFFEKLNFDKKSSNWRKLMTRGSQVVLIAILISTIVGGWLHTIDPRIPWILNGLTLIASALLIWTIKDTRIKNNKGKISTELREYFINIKFGFGQFRSQKLWFYVPIILTVQGLFYTVDWGLLRLVLLDRFYFSPFMGSVVIALSSLITVGILTLIHKNAEKMSEKRTITLISFAVALSLLLSMANIGMWGFLVIFVIYAGEHTFYPFISEVINNQTEENQRATVLSIASFLQSLPYVMLAPIIGYLNTENKLEYFLLFWAILICLAVFIYLKNKGKDIKISLVTK
ncbi:MAG: MFS transporter [Candidatus Shapirobacteria bacterium]|nr:MFS transporter [Candidatus Shapirobacteria bacterium]